MSGRTLIRAALANTRRIDGTLDSLAITHALIEAGILLGDEEAWGEGRIITALDAAGWDAPDSVITTAILDTLGFKEAIA